MVCAVCQYLYDAKAYPNGCPACAKHKEVMVARTKEDMRRASALAASQKKCAFQHCADTTVLFGLCKQHWQGFTDGPEYARARTALSDFIRRTELELRSSAGSE